MSRSQPALCDERILILAPRGRDAAVVEKVLQDHGLRTSLCPSLPALVERLTEGAGLAFVTEEALEGPGLPPLRQWLGAQPPWSDFPFVVLATRQAGRRSPAAASRLADLGNVMLLERPLNAETLSTAAQSALRARARQYQTRSHLDEQVRINAENVRLYEAQCRALQDAAQARETLALALDAAELGTFHCPMPLGTIVWNDTCKAHFWLAPEAEVDFDVFYSLLHEDDRDATRRAVESAIELRQPYDVEYRTVSPAGAFRWIRAKGRAYYDDRGQPVRFDGVTIDISRQKQLEVEREKLLDAERSARQHAERASRMKDEFLATLSHELRTPLSAILGWTHLMRHRAWSPAELSKGMETIERNAKAQARLIEELLDMSRIIAGNVRLEIQPVSLRETIEAVERSMQPAAHAKSIVIEHAVDAGLDVIAADPHRVQQILWNLVSNAVKFTPSGGSVRITAKDDGGGVIELRVRDTGEGIPKDFLPFVFERFRQADASTKRSHGGLGLGLAIVRHLVALHDGTVTAESDGLGLGSEFRVRLPILGERVAALSSSNSASRSEAGEQPRGGGPIDLDGLSIVVVDDERDCREFLQQVLEGHGAAVRSAASAQEAIDAVHTTRPQILVSDIGMPKIDGYELLERLRSEGVKVPVSIALTAFARPEDRARALDAGYAFHLVKPVDNADLLATVVRAAAALPR